MSITLDKIMMDAKLIANRLNEREKLGVALHFEVDALNKKLESMKMLQDDIEALNRSACGRTNTQIVTIINQENPHIREIQQENRELKACIEDYQRTMEHIMTKYRQHTQAKILNTKMTIPDVYMQQKDEIIKRQNEKIHEMAAIMQKAASIDEDLINKDTERIIKLATENHGLRELLQISRNFGSYNNHQNNNNINVDKSVQTEEDVQTQINNLNTKKINIESDTEKQHTETEKEDKNL